MNFTSDLGLASDDFVANLPDVGVQILAEKYTYKQNIRLHQSVLPRYLTQDTLEDSKTQDK